MKKREPKEKRRESEEEEGPWNLLHSQKLQLERRRERKKVIKKLWEEEFVLEKRSETDSLLSD